MTTVLRSKDNANFSVLYMAMELSRKTWRLGFSSGARNRQVSIDAGNLVALRDAVNQAKSKLGLDGCCPVYSCYEAGRDGFWIHRGLEAMGYSNAVIDSASIEVNRRHRRAKTDRVDLGSLLRLLLRYHGGELEVMRVVRVPSPEEEDRRRLHRERERLIKERGSHSARIQALLATQGISLKVNADFLNQLSRCGHWSGTDLDAEIRREYERFQLVDRQIKTLEQMQRQRVKDDVDPAYQQIRQLMQLKSVGWQSSYLLVMEFFGWREFRNRRQLGACAGLTPTPYDSGDSRREQGISKAGNRRIRRLMVELCWLWLRYQPDSALSQWYQRRYGHGGPRMRRIGIVAMARKLLIQLWRYLQDGEIPEGAVLKV